MTTQLPSSDMFQATVDALFEVFQTQNFPESLSYTIIRKNEADTPVPFDSYSLMNKLIAIFVGGTYDCRGYKQWQQVGRHVKKGAKSFKIIAPLMRKTKKTNPSTGVEEETVVVYGFRAVSVFADHQTEADNPDNDKLTQFSYEPDPDKLPYFLNVAEAMGLTVRWQPLGNQGALGWYRPSDKSITMTSYDFLNFFHELAHAVHDTIEPLLGVPDDKAEAVAETSAAVLCAMLGIEAYHQQKSYDYIACYCKDKTPQGVLAKISSVLGIVEKVVTIILNKASELEAMHA